MVQWSPQTTPTDPNHHHAQTSAWHLSASAERFSKSTLHANKRTFPRPDIAPAVLWVCAQAQAGAGVALMLAGLVG
jgi:hypothetical protein